MNLAISTSHSSRTFKTWRKGEGSCENLSRIFLHSGEPTLGQICLRDKDEEGHTYMGMLALKIREEKWKV